MTPTLDNLDEWDWEAALEEGRTVEEQVIGTWRWGTENERVFEFEGTLLSVCFRSQPDMGIEDCEFGDPVINKVKAVQRTITTYEVI